MKRIALISTAVLAVILSAACAKSVSESQNESAKRAFDAWMHVNYQEKFGPVGNGIYIIEDEEGEGEEIVDGNFMMVNYEVRYTSDSTFYSYTGSDVAKQMGTYDENIPYVPFIFKLDKGGASQGVMDMVAGGSDNVSGKTFKRMRIGGKRTAIIPGWLTSIQKYYDKAQDYVDNVTGNSLIYQMTVVSQTPDIIQYQIDSIENYAGHHGIDLAQWDTTAHSGRGFYYWRDKAREKARGVTVKDDVKFPDDTTIFINYVGRLLNGMVFDTNIEDSAKVWKLHSSSRTYEPVQINFKADSTALTMGSGDTGDPSGVISGFSLTIWHMHPFESGRGLFTSDFGYGASGSGMMITEYSPLIFEIDVVDNPNKK